MCFHISSFLRLFAICVKDNAVSAYGRIVLIAKLVLSGSDCEFCS